MNKKIKTKWKVALGILIIGVVLEVCAWIWKIRGTNIWFIHDICIIIIQWIGIWRILDKVDGNEIDEKHEDDCFCCRKSLLTDTSDCSPIYFSDIKLKE